MVIHLFARGHPPVAYASAEKRTIQYLTMAAPLIGCFYDSKFEEASISVTHGDVLYSIPTGWWKPQTARAAILEWKISKRQSWTV